MTNSCEKLLKYTIKSISKKFEIDYHIALLTLKNDFLLRKKC